MRHFPVGKGFLVRLPEVKDDAFSKADTDESRPPFLFVKVWKLSHEMRSGFVNVSYDLRDTGFRVANEAH